MKKKTKLKRIILSPVKLLYIKICLFMLAGCVLVSKAPLNSKKLFFKIHWTYFDSSPKKPQSLTSFVFLQGQRFLKVEVFQNFIGVVARFFLKDQVFTIQTPLNKEYYRGGF